MKQRLPFFIKWLLPIIFVGYISCVSLFEHAHIINGVIIVHSHKASDESGGATHQHTSQRELQMFHFLSHFNVGDGAIETVEFQPLCNSLLTKIKYHWVDPSFVSIVDINLSLRAPPRI